jgi:hypothetical protein
MAFVQDVTQLFANAYADMVAKRVTYGFSALQPAALSNFQIGPEFLDQEQVAPRIVIVPTESTFDFAQMQFASLAAGQTYQKPLYTRVQAFEAHIWGDPDPAQAAGYYSFNSTFELEREFIGAMYTQMMGGRAPRGSFTPVSGRWSTDRREVGMVNTYGRLYVLTFQIAMPVVRDSYTTAPVSTITTTPYVTDPVTGLNPVSTTPQVLPIT